MGANLRITLTDEQAAALDRVRGPASRTAYARWMITRDHVMTEPLHSDGGMCPQAYGPEISASCICGPDATGEDIDERPDCKAHQYDAVLTGIEEDPF